MTRQVKRPEIRKNEILNVARKFFFQKGYEQTSIQDIIDDLSIAKGTFYHYFKSKLDLLDKLTDQTTNEIYVSLKPIVESDMNATDKFNAIFKAASTMKMANIDVFVVIIKVLFKDENTIIREKMYRNTAKKTIPLYATIIKQGIAEGIFDVQSPDDVAEILIQIGTNLNETVCRLFLAERKDPNHLVRTMVNKLKIYQDTIERIIAAPKGSIQFYIPGEYENMVREFYKKLKGDV